MTEAGALVMEPALGMATGTAEEQAVATEAAMEQEAERVMAREK
jgi:hypothetical protein